MKEEGYAKPPRPVVEAILRTLRQTRSRNIGDIYRDNLQFSWTEFMSAVDYMVSEGLVVGRGDGFSVLYSLTRKGMAELGTPATH